MPHKLILDWPEWVSEIKDHCLKDVVREVIVAHDKAVEAGAARYKNCRNALKSGEKTIEQIRYGRVTGLTACKTAADALRKLTSALECAEPTATRR